MKIDSLKSEKDFNIVKRRGKSFDASCFICLVYKDYSKVACLSSEFLYLGLKVSRRFEKKAVLRNYTKRKIRAIFRNISPNLPQLSGFGITIIPKKRFNLYNFAGVQQEMQKILETFTAV